MNQNTAGRPLRRAGTALASFPDRLARCATILREEGALRLLELSVLSFSEPIRALRLRSAVWSDAKHSVTRLKRGHRGLFIDCGSNIGQSYTYFSRYYAPEFYDYILVEPNKACLPALDALRRMPGSNIEIVGKAASVSNGFASLFGPPSDEDSPTYQGCSIVPGHNGGLYHAVGPAAVVETFSLSQLILSKSGSYDTIVLKMDIEGAEYEVFDDMIRTDAHRGLYAVYVEFHSAYMKPGERRLTQARERHLIDRLSRDNVIVRHWI